MEKIIAVIPAAGAGKRLGLGINKAFALLCGVPLIVHTLQMLQQTGLVYKAIVVLAPAEVADGQKLLAEYQSSHYPDLELQVTAGGKERQDSVANALQLIKETDGYVAVHDGARPFAGREVFERTLQQAQKYGAAVAAVPVKDTIKVINENNEVIATPVRSTLQAVQTPQIFSVSLLQEAYANLREHPAPVTDDASVVELLGRKVVIARGIYENIKITTPEDLIFAENYLKQQGDLHE